MDEQTNLVENPWAPFEDKGDPLVPSATYQIYDWIGEEWLKPPSKEVNSASYATMCAKRRQYQAKGAQGTTLTPRKLLNFMAGDIGEAVMTHLIAEACVGPDKLYSEVDFGEKVGSFTLNRNTYNQYKQLEWSFNIIREVGDLTVTGHPDGIGKRNSDGEWELIECKTAANWGFKSFQADGAGDYLGQAHALMLCDEAKEKDIKAVRFFYFRKETGHLWDRVHDYVEEIAETVRTEFVKAQYEDELPAPHELVDEMEGRKPNKKPTGRQIAAFPCTYCPYLKQCQGDYEIEWASEQWGNKKPKHIFKPKE